MLEPGVSDDVSCTAELDCALALAEKVAMATNKEKLKMDFMMVLLWLHLLDYESERTFCER